MLFLLFILVVAVVYFVVTRYNALQSLAQEVRAAHANIMASMKKRIDLTNRLIDIAKGYADHEKLTHITVAGVGDQAAVGGAGREATGAINHVMQLAARFPDLKANAAYQQLMVQLEQIEADLQLKRETYNERVKHYNSALVRLPTSLFAKQLGFSSAPYFDVENADSLDRLEDFHSDDADHLKQMLADGTRRFAEGSRKVATESVRIGKIAVEKGMEKSADYQRRQAVDAPPAAEPASPTPVSGIEAEPASSTPVSGGEAEPR